MNRVAPLLSGLVLDSLSSIFVLDREQLRIDSLSLLFNLCDFGLHFVVHSALSFLKHKLILLLLEFVANLSWSWHLLAVGQVSRYCSSW